MRRVVSVLAGLLILVSAVCQGARTLPSDSRSIYALALAAPFAVVGFAVALLLILGLIAGSESRAMTAGCALIAALGLGVSAWGQLPLFTGPDKGTSPNVIVMTVDLNQGDGSVNDALRWAVSDKVDVLVLTGADQIQVEALNRGGVEEFFPFAVTGTEGTVRTVVYSTLRLGKPTYTTVTEPGLSVPVRGARPFTLVAGSATNPLADAGQWQRDLDTIRGQEIAARGNATVVAGRFNASTDVLRFRDFLGTLRDAAEQANSGWQPTWPRHNGESVPRFPLVAVDHVLVSPEIRAVQTRTHPIQGTTHLALVAQLQMNG